MVLILLESVAVEDENTMLELLVSVVIEETEDVDEIVETGIQIGNLLYTEISVVGPLQLSMERA
jgi:hypothetical protein